MYRKETIRFTLSYHFPCGFLGEGAEEFLPLLKQHFISGCFTFYNYTIKSYWNNLRPLNNQIPVLLPEYVQWLGGNKNWQDIINCLWIFCGKGVDKYSSYLDKYSSSPLHITISRCVTTSYQNTGVHGSLSIQYQKYKDIMTAASYPIACKIALKK